MTTDTLQLLNCCTLVRANSVLYTFKVDAPFKVGFDPYPFQFFSCFICSNPASNGLYPSKIFSFCCSNCLRQFRNETALHV